jgi:hypothetical protein
VVGALTKYDLDWPYLELVVAESSANAGKMLLNGIDSFDLCVAETNETKGEW